MRKLNVCHCGGLMSLALVILVLSLFVLILYFAPRVSAASKGPGFGREVVVDHQHVVGEPSISNDSEDRFYVAAPYGFSTTASFVWRTADHGQSFHFVPGDLSTFGKPTTCAD
jgi:hypothetical protein